MNKQQAQEMLGGLYGLSLNDICSLFEAFLLKAHIVDYYFGTQVDEIRADVVRDLEEQRAQNGIEFSEDFSQKSAMYYVFERIAYGINYSRWNSIKYWWREEVTKLRVANKLSGD